MHSVYACHAHFAIALLLWKPVFNLTETIKLIILSWFSFSSDYPFGLIHLQERINLIRHTLRYSNKEINKRNVEPWHVMPLCPYRGTV